MCFTEFGIKVNIPIKPTKKPRMRGLGKTPNPNARVIIIFFQESYNSKGIFSGVLSKKTFKIQIFIL